MIHLYCRPSEGSSIGVWVCQAWCGRLVDKKMTTEKLKEVECQKCNDAFAKHLASMLKED